MRSGLRTAQVGVYGTADELEAEVCPGFPSPNEYEHLDDRNWLFTSTDTPGRDLVLTRRGKRVEINVAQGANAQPSYSDSIQDRSLR